MADLFPRNALAGGSGKSHRMDLYEQNQLGREFISSFGEDAAEATAQGLREPTPENVRNAAWSYLTTGPVGPFGMARTPPLRAAIRVGDRVVGQGVTHYDAYQSAVPGGLEGEALEAAFRARHGQGNIDASGFVAPDGRWLNRSEAADYARQQLSNQGIGRGGLDAVAYERALAEHEGRPVRPEARRPDALTFDETRLLPQRFRNWLFLRKYGMAGPVAGGIMANALAGEDGGHY